MLTTITVRHCEISDGLRERAQAVVDRLGTFAVRPVEASVIFDVEGLRSTAEIRLKVPGSDPLVGTGAADDHRTALDRAEEKLRRQLERSGGPRWSRPSAAPQL